MILPKLSTTSSILTQSGDFNYDLNSKDYLIEKKYKDSLNFYDMSISVNKSTRVIATCSKCINNAFINLNKGRWNFFLSFLLYPSAIFNKQ